MPEQQKNAPSPEEPRCAYCAGPDGHWGRELVLNPPAYRSPMHRQCMADIDRWGCD